MRLFTCARCDNLLYFENVACTRCSATLGFLPDQLHLTALEPTGTGLWQPVGAQAVYRLCANYTRYATCNWMLAANDDHAFCAACRLNRTIPDLSVTGNLELWRAMEVEKRRLVYALLRLGMPVAPRASDPAGLAFDFLADDGSIFNTRDRVVTGHAQGLITINIAEADPAARERMRDQLDEPYRTLLGHFRHESGHYYWERLIRPRQWLEECRRIFGDDQLDYAQALQHHYHEGPPVDWQANFVSAYASSHPWEDWAETWAHYLHIIDTLETAWQFGLRTRPRAGAYAAAVHHDFDPYAEDDFALLIEHWLPLTFALNSLNRSMGHANAYPFVLTPTVIAKLTFVHRIAQGAWNNA